MAMTDDIFASLIDGIEDTIIEDLKTDPSIEIETGVVIAVNFDEDDDTKAYFYPLHYTEPTTMSLLGAYLADYYYPNKVEAAYIIREGYLFDTTVVSSEEIQEHLKNNVSPKDILGSKLSITIFGETLESRHCLTSILIDKEYDEELNVIDTEIIDIKRVRPTDKAEAPPLHSFFTAYANTYMLLDDEQDDY